MQLQIYLDHAIPFDVTPGQSGGRFFELTSTSTCHNIIVIQKLKLVESSHIIHMFIMSVDLNLYL